MERVRSDIIELCNAFHDCVMIDKGDGIAQAAFFVHERPVIHIPHGTDITLHENYQIHQRLDRERHIPLEPWDIQPLGAEPERVRAVGAVYWEGHIVGAPDDAVLKAVVGEDWIVQRDDEGQWKFALYVNPFHYFLPDSAPFEIS